MAPLRTPHLHTYYTLTLTLKPSQAKPSQINSKSEYLT